MSALLRSQLRLDTLGEIARDGLLRLCRAAGRHELVDQALHTLEAMNQSWADRLECEPPRASDLTDDCSPFEYSLAFERGRPDIRMLVEAQDPRSGAHHQWRAGRRLSEQLAEDFGASCTELNRVADLFEPKTDRGLQFGLWHGATFRAGGQTPEFKVYLNPLVDGERQAFSVTREALLRIGLPESAAFVSRVAQMCDGRARPVYFCLDLVPGQHSRAKVYVAHYQPEPSDAAAVLSRCSNLLPTDVSTWCASLVPAHTRFVQRPLLSCFSFTHRDQQPCGTLHIPTRCYVDNDQVTYERVLRLLDDVSGDVYKSVVRALAVGPLQFTRGLQTYVSLRRVQGARRMTVYLAPGVYASSRKSGYPT